MSNPAKTTPAMPAPTIATRGRATAKAMIEIKNDALQISEGICHREAVLGVEEFTKLFYC